MVEDQIVEVGIDQDGKLYVRPGEQTFSYIYRAAMGVGWDSLRRALFAPKAREWSYLDWFRQILAAAADEYGVRLRIGAATTWSDVPDLLRSQIERDQARSE
jgi:Integron Cassette Protein Hfx_Cass5